MRCVTLTDGICVISVRSALHWGCKRGRLDAVRLLLDAGAVLLSWCMCRIPTGRRYTGAVSAAGWTRYGYCWTLVLCYSDE